MIRTVLTLLTLAASLCAAPITYRVTVDTSAFASLNGQAEFQFNPGGTPDPLTAVVSSITGVGSYNEASRTGDVTGADPWTLGNTQLPTVVILNLTGLTSTFTFDVTLAGDALDNPQSFDGTAFTLTMRDDQGVVLTGFNEPSLWLDVSFGSVFTFAQDQQITLDEVPEPATVGLMLAGLLLAAGRYRCSRG